MMTKTQVQVIMRARTKIQASGELKVEYSSSVKVFLDVRAAADPTSPFLLSMTMVVVNDLPAGDKNRTDDDSGGQH